MTSQCFTKCWFKILSLKSLLSGNAPWSYHVLHVFFLIRVSLLSTHADRQGVDISVTVCFLSVCTVTDFSAEDKASGSNFARWFMGVLGRESSILGNFAPAEAQNPPQGSKVQGVKTHRKRDATNAPFVEYSAACGRRSACVDIRPSPMTDVFVGYLHISCF